MNSHEYNVRFLYLRCLNQPLALAGEMPVGRVDSFIFSPQPILIPQHTLFKEPTAAVQHIAAVQPTATPAPAPLVPTQVCIAVLARRAP